ncbi:hypothetical protein EW146_g10018, partial [Bondarzewia mesenterica]
MPESPSPQKDRSISRGREYISPSGRGGVGNLRGSSASRGPVDRASFDGPDDFSSTRGRERDNAFEHDKIISVGRGGAGNLRSPSRPRGDETAVDDRERIRTIEEAKEPAVYSSGRGGLGNIRRSSRSVSRDQHNPHVHSTGRGGAGNIKGGDAVDVEVRAIDEEERAAHPHGPGIHSTGRGGIANLAEGTTPAVEHASTGAEHPHAHHVHEFESSGRGGAGNIHSRSRSRGGAKPKQGRW